MQSDFFKSDLSVILYVRVLFYNRDKRHRYQTYTSKNGRKIRTNLIQSDNKLALDYLLGMFTYKETQMYIYIFFFFASSD